MPELWVSALGRLPYAEALEMQRAVARDRIAGVIPEDVLLLVEHPPVVTLGRGAKASHLVAPPALLAARGVEVFEVERGGDVTFHGPGQLVGYPVIDLKRHRRDLHWYLRQLEGSLIDALVTLGIDAGQRRGLTGVWTRTGTGGSWAAHERPLQGLGSSNSDATAASPGVNGSAGFRKIASIGVHAREWVTWHGFALNVTTDLSYFDLMVPCGIPDVEMTSVARELGRAPAEAEVADAVVAAIAGRLGLDVVWRDVAAMRELVTGGA